MKTFPAFDTIFPSGKAVVQFDGVPLSARETLVARLAFVRGAEWQDADRTPEAQRAMGAAGSFFPRPKVIRPREVRSSNGVEWKIEGGALHCRARWLGDGEWRFIMNVLSHEALLADLLTTPTEEVDAD